MTRDPTTPTPSESAFPDTGSTPRPAKAPPSGVAMGLGAGFEFTGAVVGMAAIGYVIDHFAGTGKTWTMVCTGIGLVGGFYNLVKASKRISAQAARSARRSGVASSGPSSNPTPETPITRAEPWTGRKAQRGQRVDLFAAEEIDGSDVEIEFPPDDEPIDLNPPRQD